MDYPDHTTKRVDLKKWINNFIDFYTGTFFDAIIDFVLFWFATVMNYHSREPNLC